MGKKLSAKIGDVVEVEWIDSIHKGGSWMWLSSIDWDELRGSLLYTTVGYLVEADESAIYICQSRAKQVAHDGDLLVDAMLAIPVCAIQNLVVLKKAGEGEPIEIQAFSLRKGENG